MKMMSFGKLSNRTQAALVDDLVAQGVIKTGQVISAMKDVDRANYCRANSYVDAAQATVEGQTISAPHMHGYALELLAPNIINGRSALDVGCGSGYLTVAMARINPALKVHGIDTFPKVVALSEENALKADSELLSTGRVEFSTRDGWKGYREHAPFDAIHVGAAAADLPKPLLAQLKIGGKMIIPVGPEGCEQALIQVVRVSGDMPDGNEHGVNINNPDPPMSNFEVSKLLGVCYVPLLRDRPI